jgi:AhpD family alkylhydroperoxidase
MRLKCEIAFASSEHYNLRFQNSQPRWETLLPMWRYAVYDMKNLAKLKLIEANAPEGMKAFVAFDKAALAAGAIPVKYKELMALAVAFTTQCPYCIEIHSNQARAAGVSDQEMAEAVIVTAALGAGAAITHGTHAMKAQE